MNYLLRCVLSFKSNIRLTFLFLETLVVMQHFLPKWLLLDPSDTDCIQYIAIASSWLQI